MSWTHVNRTSWTQKHLFVIPNNLNRHVYTRTCMKATRFRVKVDLASVWSIKLRLLRLLFVNEVYRFVTTVYCYNCHNSGHYLLSCVLFKTQLNSKGLSVPHRKHITFPLPAQQVNAIFRFVTTVYLYNHHNSEYFPRPVFYVTASVV
jgi:hypothetical protein